jgi:hypothetical protein
MTDSQIPNDDDRDEEPAGNSAHDAFGRPDWAPSTETNAVVDPPIQQPARTSRTRTWIAGGVAAAVLATGGFFGVDAIASHTKAVASSSARGGPGGGGFGGGGQGFGDGVFGTIKSISGTSFVVTTSSGTTETVTTTSATTATKAVTGSLSDVKAGDHVVVMGTGTTTIAANAITDSGTTAATTGPGAGGQGGPPGGTAGGPSGAGGRGMTSGTVASAGSGTLTVTETSGTTVKVTTSSSTTVTTLQIISPSDLTVGQSVMVRGTATNGAVAATSIEEGATVGGGAGHGGAPPAGQTPTNGA